MNAPKLTPEQRALARSVPGLVERAAAVVMRRYGSHLGFDELVSTGHLAVALAAQSYDPEHPRRAPFEQWAYYRAVDAMISAGRAELGQRRVRKATRAVLRFAALEQMPTARDPFAETTADLFAELTEFFGDAIVSFADAFTTAKDPESESVEQESRDGAARALEEAVAALPAEDQEVLRLRFADDQTLKETAAITGVGFWTLYRRHHDVLRELRERLVAQGVVRPPAIGAEPLTGALR